MFTMEEAALLSRMLRVLGWVAVCLAIGAALYFRNAELRALRYIVRQVHADRLGDASGQRSDASISLRLASVHP